MKIHIIIFLLLSISLSAQDNDTQTAVQQQQQKEKNGWDYYAEGNYLASIKSLEEEKKLFPGRINIYIILGWNYRALRNYSEMEKASMDGYAINPRHIHVLKNLGEALYFQNKFSEAVKYFDKYLRINNDWNDNNTNLIYGYMGISYLRTGSLYKADLALSTSNMLRTGNIQILLSLAEVNEKLSKKEKSIAYYEEVLKYDPVNAAAKTAISRIQGS